MVPAGNCFGSDLKDYTVHNFMFFYIEHAHYGISCKEKIRSEFLKRLEYIITSC